MPRVVAILTLDPTMNRHHLAHGLSTVNLQCHLADSQSGSSLLVQQPADDQEP